MKKLLSFSISLLFCGAIFAQSYNDEQTVFANYLKRMYNQTRFEGVKIVEDYSNQWFVSVLTLDKSKYKSNRDMFRVAQVKSMRQVSDYANGGTIVAETIVRTEEAKDSVSIKTSEVSVETVEKIRSVGFVQAMELLINFPSDDDEAVMVFVYGRKIEK
jgi:phage-related protein